MTDERSLRDRMEVLQVRLRELEASPVDRAAVELQTRHQQMLARMAERQHTLSIELLALEEKLQHAEAMRDRLGAERGAALTAASGKGGWRAPTDDQHAVNAGNLAGALLGLCVSGLPFLFMAGPQEKTTLALVLFAVSGIVAFQLGRTRG
ncbi:MAG: hypothetical protein Q8L14_13765 [Myxococcales bacterium]|nr:hypothetical protein [Myxococcales bacterium]